MTAHEERLREIEDAFFDIPFENSAFQNRAFVIAAQITPARAYRAIGLRITAKLRALNDALFAERKLAVDILELDEKIKDPRTPKFELMRAEIDKEEKLSHEWMTRKLIRDAEVEVDTLYAAYKALPKIGRMEFEAEEQTHFSERLLRQAHGQNGPLESLLNIDADLAAFVAGTLGETNLIAPDLQAKLMNKG